MFHYATTSNQKQRLLLAVPEFLKGNDLFPSLAEWRIWIFRLIFSVTSLWSLRSSVKRKNEDHHDPRKLWRSSWKHVAVIRRVNFENLPGDVVRLEQRGRRYRNGENPRKRSSREGWIEVWVEIGKERDCEKEKLPRNRRDFRRGQERLAGRGGRWWSSSQPPRRCACPSETWFLPSRSSPPLSRSTPTIVLNSDYDRLYVVFYWFTLFTLYYAYWNGMEWWRTASPST